MALEIFKERGNLADEMKYYLSIGNLWIKDEYAIKLAEWVKEGYYKGEFFLRMYGLKAKYKELIRENSTKRSYTNHTPIANLPTSTVSFNFKPLKKDVQIVMMDRIRMEKKRHNCTTEEAIARIEQRIIDAEERTRLKQEKKECLALYNANIVLAKEILEKKEKRGTFKIVGITDLSTKICQTKGEAAFYIGVTLTSVTQAIKGNRSIKKKFLVKSY